MVGADRQKGQSGPAATRPPGASHPFGGAKQFTGNLRRPDGEAPICTKLAHQLPHFCRVGTEDISHACALPENPRQVYVVHGDLQAADTLRRRIENEHGWPTLVPEHGSTWPV